MRNPLNPLAAMFTFAIGVSLVMIVATLPWPVGRTIQTKSPSSSVNSLVTKVDIETEKYAVYSAVIKEMYIRDGIKLLVITSEIGCPEPFDNNTPIELRNNLQGFTGGMPGLEKETINDLVAKVKECRSFERKLDIPVNYVVVPEQKIEAMFRRGNLRNGWQKFYTEYPSSSGFISFSNIGFNSKMNQALLSTSGSCGGLCGSGYHVLLSKENGVWKVSSKVITWVS